MRFIKLSIKIWKDYYTIQRNATNQEEKCEKSTRKMGQGYKWVFYSYKQGSTDGQEIYQK